VSTVKVNEKRKLLEPLQSSKNQENSSQEANLIQRNVKSNIQDQSSHDCKSDKEKRIENLVNSIKQKQQKHEKRQKLFRDLRPLIIGGSIFIGGIFIHQIFKSIFNK
jgi:hypothetical protein